MHESFHKHSTVSNSLGNNLQQFLRIRVWLQSTVCHTDPGPQTSHFLGVYLHPLNKKNKIILLPGIWGTQLCWVCLCLIKFYSLYRHNLESSKGKVNDIPAEIVWLTGSCYIPGCWLYILPKTCEYITNCCAPSAVWIHLEADFPLPATTFNFDVLLVQNFPENIFLKCLFSKFPKEILAKL